MIKASPLLINESPMQMLPSLAALIGSDEALMLQQIHYWLGRSNNVREGHVWVYKTYKEWAKEFYFWSESKVFRVVRRLEKLELLIVDNFNKMPMDRTKWYRINYTELDSLYTKKASSQNDEMDLVKMTTTSSQNEDMSFSQNEDTYNQETTKRLQQETTQESSAPDHADMFDDFWKLYPKKVSKATAERSFKKIKPDEDLFRTMVDNLQQQMNSKQWTEDNGQYIPHASTWLNQERWNDELEVAPTKASYTHYETSGEDNPLDWIS